MRKIIISLVLLLLAASPVMAEESAAMKQADTFTAAFQAAINSENPDQAAAVYTADAVLVGPTGAAFTGQSGVKKYYTDTYKQFGNHFAINNTVEHARLSGDTLWLVGNSTVQQGDTQGHTHFAIVAVRQKGGWKAELLSVGFNPPPQRAAAH